MTETATTTALRLTGLTERTFGIELELGFKASRARGAAQVPFSTIQAPLLAAFEAAGIAVQSESYVHAHTTRPHWKFVPDGSIGYGNIELVSPILKGEEGLREIEKVCAVLAPFFPTVTDSMGYHVHHGAIKGERKLGLKELKVLARLVTRFQPIFDGLLPPSRRSGNHYCRHFSPEDLRHIERATEITSYSSGRGTTLASIDRYRALNFAALARHGTVEFRQHSGTFEARKIIAWVMLTQGLVEKALDGRGRKFSAGAVAANGDGLSNLLRAAGLRTCKPHGHAINPAFEERVRAATTFFRERAKKFGLIQLTERSESRSRARRATAAERVAEITGETPAPAPLPPPPPADHTGETPAAPGPTA